MNSFEIPKDYRLPAEWEPVDAILMAWPNENTDWAYMLQDVQKTYVDIITAITERAKVVLIGPNLRHVNIPAQMPP